VAPSKGAAKFGRKPLVRQTFGQRTQYNIDLVAKWQTGSTNVWVGKMFVGKMIFDQMAWTRSKVPAWLPKQWQRQFESQGDQKLSKQICPIFQRVTQTVFWAKKSQNIYTKAKFESLKHLGETTFKMSKCVQQTMFWNCLFRWNFNKFAGAKSSPKMLPFLWTTSPFQKIIISFQK